MWAGSLTKEYLLPHLMNCLNSIIPLVDEKWCFSNSLIFPSASISWHSRTSTPNSPHTRVEVAFKSELLTGAWGRLREKHGHIYAIMCKTDSQWEAAV